MTTSYSERHTSPDDFFDLGGSITMQFTRDAAIAVCKAAAAKGLIVVRVEGGIWHYPGFEARIDCIWDGVDPPVDIATAKENNLAAASFIQEESEIHDVFIITAPSINGWK